MGRKSNMEYGSMCVNLSNLNYNSGQQVTGIVYLNLIKNYPSSELNLLLEGKEKVFWWTKHTYNDGKNTHTYYVPHWANHRTYNHEFTLAKFEGDFIPAGQYQIPFSFILNDDSPSSFRYVWYLDWHKNTAQIKYKLKVKMENSKNGKDYFKDNQEFFVNQPLTTALAGKKTESNMEVTEFCCINHGKVRTVGYFEKDAYCPGETANLVTEIENNSSQNVKSVSGSLVQSLTVNSSYFTKNHTANLKKVHIEGIPANTSRVGENAQRVNLVLNKELFKSCDEKDEAGVIGSLNTTTRGKLIQCEYFIMAKAEIEGGCYCCTTFPNSKVHIQIYNNTVAVNTRWIQPDAWNPTVYDCYVANVTDAYMRQMPAGCDFGEGERVNA